MMLSLVKFIFDFLMVVSLDTTGISHPLSSVKVDRFESDLEQVETRLHLSGSLFCTELEVEY
ncbi:protein of unknown function [Streptococcus thermophilus]|nr:protein of unknown function [Streptococcus thermophilus]CAD0124351.1 protein of unknown function [Streptococcus thermophilus]CAD0131823.1 protein of unknown function [Streptococcus thermophilus]CAD0180341.1 protein of unknown function [Streptococcus thermophilus]